MLLAHPLDQIADGHGLPATAPRGRNPASASEQTTGGTLPKRPAPASVIRRADTLVSVHQADLPEADAPTTCAHIIEPGSTAMLSEIFILRLEAILRSPIAPGTGNSDTRFVPIERTMRPAKVTQQVGK